MKRLLLCCGLLIGLLGCEWFEAKKYDHGTFPTTPRNLDSINSIADDYNSNLVYFGGLEILIFSSKREGRTDFDFVTDWFGYNFDPHSGDFSFNNTSNYNLSAFSGLRSVGQAAAAAAANSSPANELGPYVISYAERFQSEGSYTGQPAPNYYHGGEYALLFASDRTGDLDMYLTHNYQPASSTLGINDKNFTEPVSIPCLTRTMRFSFRPPLPN